MDRRRFEGLPGTAEAAISALRTTQTASLALPQPVSSDSVAEMEEKPKRRKYGNERVQVDGIMFDSRKEARYYEELMLRRKAGDLKLVLLQVPFILPGKIRYKADFLTIDRDGNYEVIDVKSEATRRNRVYINKKKQMKAIWGIEIREV